MAEVSQRLSSGVHGLSALLLTQCRPVRPVQGVHLSFSCQPTGASASGTAPESAEGLFERKPVSAIETTDRHAKTLKHTEIERATNKKPSWSLLPLDTVRYPVVELIQTSRVHETHTLYVSPSVQPVLQVGLVVGRMTCWSSKGYDMAAAVPSKAFNSPQHFREFGTLILTLVEPMARKGLPGNKLSPQQGKPHLHILELRGIARAYSSNYTKEVTPLYRSRTAYYDLLKVSPHATQSQIKTAYYKQSFIFHPDKNPGNKDATLRFSEVSEAYTVLGNITLRRKYDSGILSPSDIQSAGRPSSKEARSRPAGPQRHHHHQQQQHPRPSASQQQHSRVGGRPMFDFDAFYQAHYGEQLERERRARARKELLEERRKQNIEKWRQEKLWDLTIGVLLAAGGLILISIR